MGCYGAFPPVRMAAGFLSHAFLLGQPKKQVDVIHTELLFTHLDISRYDANNLVNMTLFADGFMKYSVKSAPENQIPANSLKVLAMQDFIIKDTFDAMTWHPAPYQFDMYLSKSVPALIRDDSVNFISTLCAKAKIDLAAQKDSMIFAIHPGGPKILDHIQELFSLNDQQMKFSREVLYEYGNMSSATIPHIWKRIIDSPEVASGTKIVTMAFGPGLTSCGFVLQKS
jgi:predicted naringenin-chalcone synthase